jgi:hypothetical protein
VYKEERRNKEKFFWELRRKMKWIKNMREPHRGLWKSWKG